MKLIPLNNKIKSKTKKEVKGLFVMVDDEDYDYLNQWNWSTTNRKDNVKYVRRMDYSGVKPRQILMHRLIMKLNDPSIFVDHKNHDTLDNRKTNLRICTRSQNQQNLLSKKKFYVSFFRRFF